MSKQIHIRVPKVWMKKLPVIAGIALLFIMILPCSAIVSPDDSTTIPQSDSYPIEIRADPSEYAATMSSTPGINLSVHWIEMIPAEPVSYDWNTTSGRFFTWNAPDYEIKELGNSTTTLTDSVYWSYMVLDPDESVVREPVIITLAAKNETSRDVIANTTLQIEWKDDMVVVIRPVA